MTVAYEAFEWQSEEILDLGNGVTFGVARASARPVGSTGRVEVHLAVGAVWEEGLIARTTMYGDIDEARAAAERLAEERGWAVSREDGELVRQLLGPFEQGDIAPLFRDDAIAAAMTAASQSFFSSDFECVFVRDDVGRASYSGLDGLRAAWLDWLLPWDAYYGEVEDVIDAHEGRVLVLTRDHARPKGAEGEVSFIGAPVWTVRDGRVARIEFYWNRRRGPGCGRTGGLGDAAGKRGEASILLAVEVVGAPHCYTTEVPLLLALLTFDHRLTATEGGTRIIERTSFSGPLA